jgi:serine phosphatase RsbU (regulator of sigma subunit)
MSSLNPRTVLERLVSLVTRRFADACVVMVPGDHGLQRAVVRGRGLMGPDAARRLVNQADIPFDSNEPAAVAFRTGVPQIVDVTDDLLEHVSESLVQETIDGRVTALLVRLSAHGEMLGVMAFLAGPRRGRFNADEISLAVEVAARAGLALDNAKRFAREHNAAEMLQRAVLPRRLPAISGLSLSAEYRPGIADMPAGGDWYDAVALTGGRLYFSVGDVMGKGTPAAALMGQVRSALRAYAVLEPSPAVVLERTDVLFDTLQEDRLVTAVVGTVDPATGQVRLANAGHPAPVVIGADGAVRMVEGGNSLLLGTGALRSVTSVPSRTEHRFDLDPGDTLVLFSDGLLERRGEHLAKGFKRLVDAVDSLRSVPEEDEMGPLATRLVDLVSADEEVEDDVVVLCITLLGPPGTRTGTGASATPAVRNPALAVLRGTPIDVPAVPGQPEEPEKPAAEGVTGEAGAGDSAAAVPGHPPLRPQP